MKKPTIRDIAAMANVSPASVSMILNEKSISRFSEETIDKVYQCSQELGYITKKQRRHKTAKELIIIICPSLINPYYATLTQSMEQEASARGYTTMIFTTYWNKDSERKALEFTAQQNVIGIIFAMIPQQPQLAEEFSLRIPMVAVGDRAYNLRIDTVDVNNYAAGRMVASHLIELGHRNAAYISTPLNSEHSARVKRCNGLQDEYFKACPEGNVIVYTRDISSHTELYTIDIEHSVGYDLTKQCLHDSPQVTAIVAVNDMVAYGVIDALKDSGKRIPEDISVCGFDNIYPSGFHGVNLTTVEHAIVERGRSSMRLLSEKLQGQSDFAEDNAITRVEYQSNLIKRSSSGPSKALSHTDIC